MEPLLSIGAFARAVDLAPSALRYYDEAGLLPPAEVDVRTGYRYYTPELERRAAVIRRLREVGVSVETMRVVLDGTAEQASAALQEVSDRAEDSAHRTTEAVADVRAILATAERAAEPVEVVVPGPGLAAALQQVSRAACTGEGSPLAGVLVEASGSQVSIAATNRYWLAAWSMALPGARVSRARSVVPLDAVQDLARWLLVRGTVSVSLRPQAIGVSSADEERSVPTLEDRFPAWRLVVDDQPAPTGRAVVPRDRLLQALTGSTAVLMVGDDRVTVRPDDGPEGVRLPAATRGERMRLGFPVALLRAVVQMTVGPQVSFDYAAADCAVQVGSPSQPQLRALLMPA